MATIDIRDIRKSYGATEVIKGLDCAVGDGALLVMLGPSGCGKSTLLRMVAGLERITAGEIAIGGTVVNTLEPKDRNIAMVFQNYALYPHMSVFDNMAYGLKIRGMPKAEIARAVAEAAAILELTPFLDRRPRQLSGGQRPGGHVLRGGGQRAHDGAGGRAEDPAGQAGPRAAACPHPRQICFSGICTRSPSSASETLSWQVRRERTGSGCQAKSSMSSSIASFFGRRSTQAGST